MGPRLLHALLQRVADTPPDSDVELLRRFAESRDEPAFVELVRRYGGLVWGQCRNLLPSEADAEDAFQATFLVLARRPDAVRSAVGPYLHGIAYRVCLNARRLAGRRKKREAVAAVLEAERPVADSAWDAALATVHDELHRLPDPQREAFVLCVLEGRGLTDAAGHLGVKLGTLSARLSRAKQTLMDRLTAKGVVASVAAATALAPAGVAAAVAAKAVQAAVASAGGSAVIPESVLALTHGVTRMVTSKLKLLAAGVLLACGFGLSVGTGWVANAQDKPTAKKPSAAEQDVTDLHQAEAKFHDLRLKLLQAQAELDEARRKAQSGAAKPVAPAPLQPEFKYVPIAGDGMISTKNFEKLIAENEQGGYTFVGSAPLSGKRFLNKAEDEAITTLVFRKKAEHAKPVAAAPDPKPEKLYTVNFDNVPWQKVIEWLAKEANLTLIAVGQPQGNCRVILDHKVTIGELMDALNEMLAQQKLTLVRGEQTLRLWPTDTPRLQTSVRTVRVEDLDKFGKSEVVQVVIPLDGITSEDAEKLVKKRMSQFGEVTTIAEKQLVVIDRAGEVRAVIAAMKEQLKQQPVAPAMKQASSTVDLGPKGGDLAGAVIAIVERKYQGKPNMPSVFFEGTKLTVRGEPDVVKWVLSLLDLPAQPPAK